MLQPLICQSSAAHEETTSSIYNTIKMNYWLLPGLKPDTKDLTHDVIIEATCRHFKITDLKSRERKHISSMRYICMYLIRKYCKMTLADIAALFTSSKESHTLTRHGLKWVNNNFKNVEADINKILQLSFFIKLRKQQL